MEYELFENSQILLNPNSPKSSWNINTINMDNNEEYFNSWNSLKIDETNNNNNNDDENDKDDSKRKKRKYSNDDTTSNKNKIIDNSDTSNKQIRKISVQNGGSRMSSWQVEDIPDYNGDSSLSLGSDLTNNSYNVNDTILSISGLTVFKQEAPSPDQNIINIHRKQLRLPSPTNSNQQQIDDTNNQSIISQLLNQSAYTNLQNAIDVVSTPQDSYNVALTNFTEDCRFQYVLAAATSIATKLNEDTLTYLNQGQSYEIKLKKLGDLSMYRGKTLRSIIRICFHERRLQYMEKEQMILWQQARPGDRILEVDVPLSYGAYDIVQPSNALNLIHFHWDPTKEVGVYIKVNCISTEFTPKKHGGEKGVPFRIQVETYQNVENIDSSARLHAAACQIKVFKLKGADRKHKQDREKIMKRPLSEQEKYQPSYECTVLNDIPNDAVLNSPPVAPITTESDDKVRRDELLHFKKETNGFRQQLPQSTTDNNVNDDFHNNQLMFDFTPEDTVNWLTKNRFEKYLDTFSSFSGIDMLRMSRDDLLQICGPADGIRLFNAVHLKPITPKLKFYICQKENGNLYNAIFLSSYDSSELIKKLASLVNVPNDLVHNVCLEGPKGIRIKLSNDVMCHIKEETMFSLDMLQEDEKIIFLLKH